jgi:hypothetical protein
MLLGSEGDGWVEGFRKSGGSCSVWVALSYEEGALRG